MAAITNVELDHMDRLGPTVAAIAREKAAIIERGDLAVTGATGDALAVVRRRARRLGVPLTEVAAAAPCSAGTATGSWSSCRGSAPTRVGLRGRHQAANVAVADAVLDALEAAGIATVAGGRAPARLRRGALARPPRAARDASERAARSCSTAPTTRPARRRSPGRSTTSARSSGRRRRRRRR